MNTQTQNNWNDFNDAEAQLGGFDLIPRGAIVPVRMTIKPGGFDDASQGWTGGYASESFDTGSVFLSCEFVVTAGLGPDGTQFYPRSAQQRTWHPPAGQLATSR